MNSNKIVRLARNAGFAMNGDKLAMPVGVTIENLLERFYLLATKQGHGALMDEGDKPQQEHMEFLATWQGLTDEEIAEAIGDPIDGVYLADFRKVEAKLREKNHAALQRQPLTDEQIWDICCKTSGLDFYLNFARAIEAAHGIGGEA